MAKRDRAEYMREYRQRRKAADATNRTERVTLFLTPNEIADLSRYLAAEWSEFPEHASLADMIRAELRYMVVPLPESDDDPPHPEAAALLESCHATGCRCPVHHPPAPSSDTRTWRECAARDGTPTLSARNPRSPVTTSG